MSIKLILGALLYIVMWYMYAIGNIALATSLLIIIGLYFSILWFIAEDAYQEKEKRSVSRN